MPLTRRVLAIFTTIVLSLCDSNGIQGWLRLLLRSCFVCFLPVCRRASMTSPKLRDTIQLLILSFTLCGVRPAYGQRDLKDIPIPDSELERRTFRVPDGFEVNLFAADPVIAKPIQMNFDEQADCGLSVPRSTLTSTRRITSRPRRGSGG